MNKKVLAILPISLLLISCNKTDNLYKSGYLESTEFRENYYTDWAGIDKYTIKEEYTFDASDIVKPENPQKDASKDSQYKFSSLKDEDQKAKDGKYLNWRADWNFDKGTGYGPTKCLSNIDNQFAYGYLSKLYDGRVRCDGFYAKSRVQLNKTGYATTFPKELKTGTHFGFATRGGTTCATSLGMNLHINYTLAFYKANLDNTLNKYVININNTTIITDGGGETNYYVFYFEDVFKDAKDKDNNPISWNNIINGFAAMSLTYELLDTSVTTGSGTTYLLTDDKEKEIANVNNLFTVMLYEVLIPDSTWN